MAWVKGDAREPFCIHSDYTQPASMCRICKDGDDLKEWKAYWDEILSGEKANGNFT